MGLCPPACVGESPHPAEWQLASSHARQAPYLEDVLSSRKTQTVRLKQPRVTVGKTYAVQTSFRSPALGRIRVTGVREGTLRGLTRGDLDAEGWPGRARADFERSFAEINHFGPETMSAAEWERLRDAPLWVIDFEPSPE